VALQAGWPEIRFVLRSASIIDEATGRGRTRAWSNVVGPVRDVPEVRSTYPEPPRGNFSRSGEADILFARWESVVRGRESLTSAAYAALTVVEGAFGEGDRPKAAQALRISANVLDLIGTLSAQGDPATARKITSAPQRPLTEAERVWLEAAFECSRCAPVRWPQRGMLGRFVS